MNYKNRLRFIFLLFVLTPLVLVFPSCATNPETGKKELIFPVGVGVEVCGVKVGLYVNPRAEPFKAVPAAVISSPEALPLLTK